MNEIVIIAGESIRDVSPAGIRDHFAGKQIEKALADVFAVVSNKFWCVVDNEYDYEEETLEHITACAVTDEWGSIMDEYEEKIFEILRGEGITIPETGRIHVLEYFMKRNGYINSHGWWVKVEN